MRIVNLAVNDEALPGTGEDRRPPAPTPESIVMAAMQPSISRAIYTIVALGVPELINAEPQSTAELAERLSVRPLRLHQILRLAAATGVLRTEKDGRFSLTEDGRFLLAGHPTASRDLILTLLGPTTYAALGASVEALETGLTGIELTAGVPVFEYYPNHPDEAGSFNRMMTAFHTTERAAVTAAYDFSSFGRVVDVGGGIGSLIREVLTAAPLASGTLFDLPHVTAAASEALAGSPVFERLDFVAGDFFESIPVAGADAYLLSHIIHDWDDEAAAKILETCRDAMGPSSRLLIIEGLIPGGDEMHPLKMMDVVIGLTAGGCERTLAEYESLLTAAGLKLAGVTPTKSLVNVIEARRR
jgi:hypothetical protein